MVILFLIEDKGEKFDECECCFYFEELFLFNVICVYGFDSGVLVIYELNLMY